MSSKGVGCPQTRGPAGQQQTAEPRPLPPAFGAVASLFPSVGCSRASSSALGPLSLWLPPHPESG